MAFLPHLQAQDKFYMLLNSDLSWRRLRQKALSGNYLSEKRNGFFKPLEDFGENERAKWHEHIEEQRRQLLSIESNDLRLTEHRRDGPDEEFSCVFEDTCYAAKSNMGKCPCELRSTMQ
jgi:hypothetical protein